VQELIDELRRMWDWLRVARPIRVLITSTGGDILGERRVLESRLNALPDVELLTSEQAVPAGTPAVTDAGDTEPLRRAVSGSDIIVFLALNAGHQPEPELLESLADHMTPISMAHQHRKRGLVWGLVRPRPDTHEPPDPEVDAARSPTPISEPRPRRSLGGVLRDRDVQILREAWKGNVSSGDAVEREILVTVQRAAAQIRLVRRILRVLAAAASAVLAGWLLLRFGFFGLLLVLALAGGAYLWLLNRRWSEPG